MKTYFDKLCTYSTNSFCLFYLHVCLKVCLSIYFSISLSDRHSTDRQDKPGHWQVKPRHADQARTGRPSPNGVTPGQDHAQTGPAQTGPAQAGHALTSPNVQQATHEIAKRAL